MATSRTGTAQWKRLRARLIRERSHVCHWCGKALDPQAPRGASNAIEVDHVVPVSLRPDLAAELSNLVLVCHPCNRSKGARQHPKAGRSTVVCAFHSPAESTCPHSRDW